MYAPVVIRSQPGVKRDGTVFEGDHYIDAQWCRFYRGLPRKIGGYRAIDKYLPEIGRGVISYTQTAITYVHVGSANKLVYFYIGANGNPSIIYDRTPTTLERNNANVWQFDIIVDSSQVPPVNQIVAQVAPNIDCLCNAEGGQVFIGPLIGTTPLVEITTYQSNFISSTGGVLSLNPYLFIFGNDGSIGWSAAGRPQVFDTYESTSYTSAFTTSAAIAAGDTFFIVEGNASGTFVTGEQVRIADSPFYTILAAEYVGVSPPGVTRVSVASPIMSGYPINSTLTLQTQTLTGAGNIRAASQKIVAGLPLRGGGGNSPAGLFWSTDAVIRGNFVGGELVFAFDTLSVNSSILSSQCVIEQDGVYYWIGTDRFLQFNGVVRELPNPLNLNWFFNNLNQEYTTKVFGFRVPRFGEIWWCFPFGTATECTHAIIYNIREQTWYDTVLPNGGRSAGQFATVQARPLLAGTERNDFFNAIARTAFDYPVDTTSISIAGDWTNLISIGTFITFRNNLSLGYQTVQTVSYTAPNTTITFTTTIPYEVPAQNYVYIYTVGYNFWQHEFGTNEYISDAQEPVLSYFETSDISLTTQNPPKNKVLSVSLIEPDFVQKGDMTLQITGAANSRSVNETSQEIVIAQRPTEAYEQVVHFKTERRFLRFKFKSDVIDGDYQMGQVLAHIEESDGRYLGGLK